jgi:O-methyltransferase involved in polyketide biosynthesis
MDHPATQQAKLKKLGRILGAGSQPGSITLVPVDFSCKTLADHPPEYGYSEQLNALFIWAGGIIIFKMERASFIWCRSLSLFQRLMLK